MTTLKQLAGSHWHGASELWLDPLGNEVEPSACTLTIADGLIRYTWSFKDKAHEGSFKITADGAEFVDTFHASSAIACTTVPDSWALLTVFCTYGAGEGPDWGWRSTVCLRPDGDLVLQMDNIAPWGESGRAVRMTFKRLHDQN